MAEKTKLTAPLDRGKCLSESARRKASNQISFSNSTRLAAHLICCSSSNNLSDELSYSLRSRVRSPTSRKMLKVTIIAMAFAFLAISAFPATEDNKFDKATQIDVSVNSVTPKVTEDGKKDELPHVSITSSGSIGISAPGDNGPAHIPLPPPPKIRPGNTFARFIDDVFQIPITVLQSVTKLLTNPFTQHGKDDGSS